jgi:uncharacterized protein YjaG (DUF416 family)
MDTSWIQVFILTLAECVAPAGKSVCQEQQFELQFLSREDCEYALEQLVAAKSELEYVIVDRQKSGCVPSATQSETYDSLEAINAALGDSVGWRVPGDDAARRAVVQEDHRKRLVSLMPCEDTGYVVPCRVGEIIVEEINGDNIEVWKQD